MKIRESKGLKLLASLLLTLSLTALAVGLSGVFTLLCYYRVLDDDAFLHSGKAQQQMQNDINELDRCYQYERLQAEGYSLSFYQQETLRNAPSFYGSSQDSNFLWVIVDDNGEVLKTNLDSGDPLYELERETNSQINWYGTEYSLLQIMGDTPWEYYEKQWTGTSETTASYYIGYGLRASLSAPDSYAQEADRFAGMRYWLKGTAIGSLAALVVSVILFGYLAAAAGHSRGTEGIRLNVFDRIWVEVWIALTVILASIVLGLASDSYYSSPFIPESIAGTFFLWGLAVCLLSLIRRGKAKKLYTTSLLRILYRLVRAFGRLIRGAVAHARAVTKALVVSLLVVLFELICLVGRNSGEVIFLWLCGNTALVLLAVWVTVQYDTLRKATDRMAEGELGEVVQEREVPLFKPLASNLNHCGEALTAAVQEATRSERLKTELITNVSHDIKTPLTSIISYVDLLKTTDIQDAKALEYIAVLEKKSKRLAQLMVDLVEASKVTSGNISVEIEPLNFSELVKQAAGEFEARLEENGMQLLCRLPEEPVMVMADGRHMWRVLDNLFGNTVKYALEGTRVYVDLTDRGGEAELSVKNISRDPLNIQPEELMERFVRGDQSRHTEGSGLGLSIARSLIELQGGSLELSIDGDLFKVLLRMKAMGAVSPG